MLAPLVFAFKNFFLYLNEGEVAKWRRRRERCACWFLLVFFFKSRVACAFDLQGMETKVRACPLHARSSFDVQRMRVKCYCRPMQ